MPSTKKKTPPDEVMIVNDSPGEECRIAILEDNHLEELYTERLATATKVGNIYKGRVVNVEPAIQAAFIDYGEGANGFLHISDLHPRYFPGAERVERVGRKIPRRERPPIQEALRRGDEVMIQVLKEGIGTKGPTLTSYLSIPGRLLVVMPDMDRVGVSRKVEDEEGRREMRKILDSVELPEGFGFILRTAGIGKTKTELKRDVAYLMRMWKVMEKRIQKVGAPCELYTESDLLIRTVRDVLRPAIKAIVVDSESAYDRITTFLSVIAPRSAPEVVRYTRSAPIFHTFDIERQIELIHSREVPLPSGGRLVIDQTEALVAIDVNSGRSRSARDSETNAFNTNCEAVDEICRQLRLRDLGGLIINDLIDMRHHRHRRSIEERFQDNLKRDRARSTILKISEFGLVEMTRQRMRPSMRKSHFMTCPQCEGHGEIKAPDSVAADVARQVSFLLDQKRVQRLEIVCSPRVASVLLSRRRRQLVRLEDATGKAIDVRVSDDIPVDRVDYYAYDDRNADIDVTRLPAAKLPTLSDLQREAAAAEGGEAAATEETAEVGRKKRSRRRRRPGPADATAIALAGGFEDDDEEEEEVRPEGKKRSRRRRRRRKSESGAGEATTSTPRDTEAQVETAAETETKDQPAEVGAADDGAPVRIHQLAKEIGVPSREIVSRCKESDEIEVRNHMSSVTAAEARTIRGWFGVDATEPPVLEADGADAKPAKTGRKRRRRGGRRRGRGDGPAPDATQTETSAGSEETASDDGKPQPAADDDTERAPRKRSRRGRRGGRRRRGGNDDESTPPEPQNADAAAPAPAREEPEPVASPAEVTPKPDPAAAKPKRRTLYGGSRRRLSTADREALEIEK